MYALSYKRISEVNGRNTIGIFQGVPLDVAYVFLHENAYTFETVSSNRLFLGRKNDTFSSHYDSLKKLFISSL